MSIVVSTALMLVAQAVWIGRYVSLMDFSLETAPVGLIVQILQPIGYALFGLLLLGSRFRKPLLAMAAFVVWVFCEAFFLIAYAQNGFLSAVLQYALEAVAVALFVLLALKRMVALAPLLTVVLSVSVLFNAYLVGSEFLPVLSGSVTMDLLLTVSVAVFWAGYLLFLLSLMALSIEARRTGSFFVEPWSSEPGR